MAKRKRHTVRRTHRRIARKSFFRSKLFYFLGLTVLGLFVIGQYAKTHVSPQNVLSDSSSGGDHGGGGDSHEGSGGSSSGGGSSGGTSGGSSGGSSNTTTQQAPQTQQNIQKTETETRVGNTEVKTKVEDNGAVKIEGARPGFQFKLETENGLTRFHIEDAQGRKLGERAEDEVENELENEGVEISTEDGKLAIKKDDIRAVSELPLSVDSTKTQILITTPNGKTVPVILPNVAIENMARVGFLTSSVSGQATGSPSGFLTLSTNASGIPVYYVPAFRNQRFLGIIPVQVPVTTEVSAETGAIMGQQQNFFSQLLGALSF